MKAQCPFCNKNLQPTKLQNVGLSFWPIVKAFGRCDNINCDSYSALFAKNKKGDVYSIPCNKEESGKLYLFKMIEFV